jgi:arylsulfatase A-like enzyme
MRQAFLVTIAVIGIVGPAGAQDTDTRPPNIILILADDLGYGDVGVYGGKTVSTPHIDALAEHGVRLTEGYVSHPVCSPSRAGLLTGRYQQRHGWEFNPAGRDRTSGMSLDEQTFADVLRSHGYTTGMVGKWHLGHQKPFHPLNRGFDEFFGILEGGSTYIDSRVPGVEYASIVGEPAPTHRPNKILRGFDEVKVDRYLTDVFTDQAVNFIERNRRKPFFLYLSHITPHTPLQATAPYLDRYRHIEDDRTRVYSAMVASLDDSVGRVVDTLKKNGLHENTLIVFLSDNGCAGYIQGACSNAPLAGYKRYHQDGGIRVPFIIQWPNGLPSGETYTSPAISLDLLATFEAAAGDTQTRQDSVNLLPFLKREQAESPHEYLYWRSGPTVAIRDARWKLIKYNKTDFRPSEMQRGSRRLPPPNEGWSMDSPHGQITLLYDLDTDPGEARNLAADQPDQVERLQAEFDRWSKGLVEPIIPAMRSTLIQIEGENIQLIF